MMIFYNDEYKYKVVVVEGNPGEPLVIRGVARPFVVDNVEWRERIHGPHR